MKLRKLYANLFNKIEYLFSEKLENEDLKCGLFTDIFRGISGNHKLKVTLSERCLGNINGKEVILGKLNIYAEDPNNFKDYVSGLYLQKRFECDEIHACDKSEAAVIY